MEGATNRASEKLKSDREVKQVTHRDFKTYLEIFNLPKESLSTIKSVVDIGAGFSTFSKEAREKYKELNVIAVDPVYTSLKNAAFKSSDELARQEKIFLDFNPIYRKEKEVENLDLHYREQERFFWQFIIELSKHPNEYVAASHQKLPFFDKSKDLILASNSILRNENSPEIIEQALKECLRIITDTGEIRIAGAIACFSPTTESVELWYNGTVVPGSIQAEELKTIGYSSDPKLMNVFAKIEAEKVNFYCVIKRVEEKGTIRYRFDTLIARKDNKIPSFTIEDSETIKTELRKLEFSKNDGFSIPTFIV